MRPFRVSGCPEIQQSRESPSVGHHRSYQTSRAVNLWLPEEFQPTPTNVYLQLFPYIAIKIPLSSQEATWRDRFRFNWQGPIDGLTEERRESRIKEERPRDLLLMFLNQINYKTIPKWSYSMRNGGLNNLFSPSLPQSPHSPYSWEIIILQNDLQLEHFFSPKKIIFNGQTTNWWKEIRTRMNYVRDEKMHSGRLVNF